MYSIVDDYYSFDNTIPKTKKIALTKVMKGAIWVSKSNMGDAIAENNRLQREKLTADLLRVKRQRTFNMLDLEINKRRFLRLHKDSVNRTFSEPAEITSIKRRFKELKKEIKVRSKALSFQPGFKPNNV